MEMDYTIIFILVSVFTWFYFLISQSSRRKLAGNAKLPPGPYPVPIIGSIFKLGRKPHRSFAALSKTYGPLMSLKLGSNTTIVVSSREVAQEIFTKHDISFSSRSVAYAGHAVDRHKFSLIFLPVGDQWRMLRRIAKEQLFSTQQLDASQLLRKKKVQELVGYVHGCSVNGKAVNIGETASTTSLNFLSNFIFSTDLAQYDSVSSGEFKDLARSLMEIVAIPNLADFFPVLRPLDPNGLLRKVTAVTKKLMAIFERQIDNRLQVRRANSSDAPSSSKDLTDLLLDLSESEQSSLNLDDIRHLLFDLFLAGTDTTSSTLEWAMAELIRAPEILSKARSELEQVIRNEDRTIEESDISRLPYLQAIVKETLRLHAPTTFLVPRKTKTNVEIQGYVVPQDSRILFNLWAMGRDPNVWTDAETFNPERFLDIKIDYKGHDYEFIPFGAGRRLCPGLPLAQRMVHLMLGSLIYKFDWKMEDGMRAQDMDMEEKFGFTLQKKLPLMAIPVKL